MAWSSDLALLDEDDDAAETNAASKAAALSAREREPVVTDEGADEMVADAETEWNQDHMIWIEARAMSQIASKTT